MHLGLSASRDRRPLDPQDYGLGVSADQSGHSGGVVSVPTCWLSGRMHAVWSQDGSQDGTACMPYLVKLSVTIAHLGRAPARVRAAAAKSKPVGVICGCRATCTTGRLGHPAQSLPGNC
jgi:hypothetical protein